MLKITSKVDGDRVDFEIEDDTEDFDTLGLELTALIRYSYDIILDAAREGGAPDPVREAGLFIDGIVNDAINGNVIESSDEPDRSEILHLVDDYVDKNRKNNN